MEQEKTSSEYIKGFNEGYIIRKHSPELAEKLRDLKSNSDRSVGFIDGQRQFEQELNKEKRPEWLKPISDKEIMPDKEADKDIEPDR